jgi:hypothetical protein
MIKFFRKIRRKLLTENKFSKYLLYAIGEIVLVVIGIIIALQVNNWNENRKDRALEHDYYCRILDDFNLEQKHIKEYYENTNQKIEAAKQLLQDMYHSNKDNYTMMNNWIETQRLPVYVPRRVAFNDLTSSGNFKILTDVEIKNSLALYYDELENILRQMNQNRDFLVNRSYPEDPVGFGIQELDYLKSELGEDIYALLDKPNWLHNPNHPNFQEFQNDIVMTIALYDRAKQHLSLVSENMKLPYKLVKNKCHD